MTTIDTLFIVNKYSQNINRHVTFNNNAVFWLTLNANYVSYCSTDIIVKYKQYLDQSDFNGILDLSSSCNIYIFPILFKIKIDYDQLSKFIIYRNITLNTLKLLHNIIGLDDPFFVQRYDLICSELCKNGDLMSIKYLHKHVNLTKINCVTPYHYYWKVNIVKYFHKVFNISDPINNYSHACYHNDILLLKYTHKYMYIPTEYTIDIVKLHGTNIIMCCENNHLDCLRYVHKKMKMKRSYFSKKYKYYLRSFMVSAIKNDNEDIVKYLKDKYKLRVTDYW